MANIMANMAADMSGPGLAGHVRVVSSAEAKNQFGQVLDDAAAGETVVITRYGESTAVLISADRYRALSQEPRQELNLLTDRFNRMLAEMQATKARKGMRVAFNASPEEMGRAAVAGGRRRAARRGA